MKQEGQKARQALLVRFSDEERPKRAVDLGMKSAAGFMAAPATGPKESPGTKLSKATRHGQDSKYSRRN